MQSYFKVKTTQWTEIVQWLIWFYLKVPQRIFTFSNTARDLPLNKEVEGSGYEIKGMKSSLRKQPRGKFMSTNQKQYPDLGNDASTVWNSCARFSVVIWRETSGSVAKCRLFSQARWNIEGKACYYHVIFLIFCFVNLIFCIKEMKYRNEQPHSLLAALW